MMMSEIFKQSYSWTSTFHVALFKGELGELEFYFRRIPLHPQKFLLVSVLSNSPWFAEKFEKLTKMKLLSTFQLATLFAKQRCMLEFFVFVARW